MEFKKFTSWTTNCSTQFLLRVFTCTQLHDCGAIVASYVTTVDLFVVKPSLQAVLAETKRAMGAALRKFWKTWTAEASRCEIGQLYVFQVEKLFELKFNLLNLFRRTTFIAGFWLLFCQAFDDPVPPSNTDDIKIAKAESNMDVLKTPHASKKRKAVQNIGVLSITPLAKSDLMQPK